MVIEPAMPLTPELAAEIDGIVFANRNGFIESRVGFAIELYFLGGETAATRLALCGMLRDYHALFGDELSHFLKMSGSRLTTISGTGYLDYYEEKARSMAADEPMDAMIYGYPGKIVVDEPTPLSISFTATGPEPLSPLGRSMISAYFPAAFVAARGSQMLLDLTKRWAAAVATVHGGAGYSLLFEHGIFAGGSMAAETVLPALKRFPGLDFSDPLHFEVESDLGDGRQIKSINWLTVVDDEIAERLGGADSLAARLGLTCPILPYDGGLILQAGGEPQLGDADCGLVPDDYRRVAQALKPVRFEAYRRGLFVLPESDDPIGKTLAWLRRFD